MVRKIRVNRTSSTGFWVQWGGTPQPCPLPKASKGCTVNSSRRTWMAAPPVLVFGVHSQFQARFLPCRPQSISGSDQFRTYKRMETWSPSGPTVQPRGSSDASRDVFAFPPPSPPAPHLAGGHELEAAQGSVIAWSPTGDVPTQADQADSLAKRIALLKGFL